MSRYDKFLRDPLWFYLIGISFLTFVLANSTVGYILSSLLTVFSIITIFFLYIDKAETLRNIVSKEFSSFSEDYTVLSSVNLQGENGKAYSDFIVISKKGVFNIRLLDFEGIIKGFESENYWRYVKLSSSTYNSTHKAISNPFHFHERTHSIIEDLLANNNIKYIPIQSIIVIRNDDAEIITNSTIPIVKAKHIKQYISQYTDRQNMSSMLDEIIGIMKNQVGYCS